jgi:hypothetical protein
MFYKSAIPVVLLLALVFIGFGDRFLPPPLNTASFRTRTSLNQWMTSSFNLWQPKTNPHQRTERAIKQQEKGGK